MKFISLSLILGSVLVLGLSNGPAKAQTKAKPETPNEIRVGVLDVSQVRRSSKMGQDIVRQRNALGKSFQTRIQGAENELRKLSEELKRKSAILSPEAMQKEQQKFGQKRIQLQQEVQTRRRQLADITAQATRAFEKEIEKAVVEAANRTGLTLILKRSTVILRANFLDVTPEIVTIVNRNIPSYKLPAATAAAAAAPGQSGK